MNRITIVSSDSHIGPSYEVYRPYMDPAYRDRMDDLARNEQLMIDIPAAFVGGHFAGADRKTVERIAAQEYLDSSSVKKRLKMLDEDGIAGEILLAGAWGAPPFFHELNFAYPTDLRLAGTRAHHRWLADFVAEGEGRMFGHAFPLPTDDIKVLLDELDYVSDNGFVSIEAPGFVPDRSIPPLHSPMYEPFWAAIAERGLVLFAHAGYDLPQGAIPDMFVQLEKTLSSGEGENAYVTMMAGTQTEEAEQIIEEAGAFSDILDGPRRALWRLMIAGVFDRHPTLKLMFSEVRCDWVPTTLRFLDEAFDKHKIKTKLKPSEYFERNCSVTPTSPRQCEVAMRHEIGVDRFFFGSDFPHPEGTWPTSQLWIRDAFKDVSEDEVRKILGENAIRLFNLDRGPLDAAAARVGPTMDEIAGGEVVGENLLATFDRRAGYRLPVDKVDLHKIQAELEADLETMKVA